MKNQRFRFVKEHEHLFHGSILLLILVLAIGAIFLQSVFKFTGFVTGPTGCDGNWTSTTSDLINSTTHCTNTTFTSNDTTTCGVGSPSNLISISQLENCSIITPTCTANLTNITGLCTKGFHLINETHVYANCSISSIIENLTCTYCGDSAIQAPNNNGINEECDGGNIGSHTCVEQGFNAGTLACKSDCTLNKTSCCSESWDCGAWSNCSSETQTRTCTDSNSCGTTASKPTESRSCTEEQSTEVVEPQVPVITAPQEVTVKTCTPNWQCGSWTECANKTQSRTCVDSNTCNSLEGIPETSQSCVVEIKETCSDGIKNQNEQGIDCGGVCKNQCGFFSIMGSAVSGTIDAGKTFILKGMFGSLLSSIISVVVLVLVIGGFIISRFFLKRTGIKKLDKAIDNLPKKKDF